MCVCVCVRVCEVGECKGQDSSGEGVCVLSCFSRVCGACVCVCARVKLLQLCLILCDPLDCSPPGSSVHDIL